LNPETGAFTSEIDLHGQEQALVVYANDFALAGYATISPDDGAEGEKIVEVRLAPSIHVKAEVTCSQLGGDAGRVTAYWTPTGTRLRPATAQVQDGRIDLYLPRLESWNYWLYGQQVKSISNDAPIDPDASSLDLGTLDLKATFIAMNIGKSVEDWKVTDARGLDMNAVQIRDFKGKWVLAEFWGFW
jgi:hypothetical protein